MRTAERRDKLLRLICKRRFDTIDNLAKELGVSSRTVRRDIERLSETEPIYTRQGNIVGGVYVVDGYYCERLFMTDREINTLKFIATYFKLHPNEIDQEDTDSLKMIIEKYSKPKLNVRRKNNDKARKRAVL